MPLRSAWPCEVHVVTPWVNNGLQETEDEEREGGNITPDTFGIRQRQEYTRPVHLHVIISNVISHCLGHDGHGIMLAQRRLDLLGGLICRRRL